LSFRRRLTVSIATLRPPAAVYREEQAFAWPIYGLLAVMACSGIALAGLRRPAPPAHVPGPGFGSLGLAASLGIPLVLVVGVLRMTTVVTPGELHVWFGWLPTYRKVVLLGTVQRVEVVRYRPFADFGGWGIRIGRDGERALNARGDRGVRLFLADGTRLLIGSQRPEELARVIAQALPPGPTDARI
jgi:hypothetical protein